MLPGGLPACSPDCAPRPLRLLPQASLQGGEGAPSRRILLESLSSQNSLADPGWGQHGERELAELADDMLRHRWRLPLYQVGAGSCSRSAGEPQACVVAASLHNTPVPDSRLPRTPAHFRWLRRRGDGRRRCAGMRGTAASQTWQPTCIA